MALFKRRSSRPALSPADRRKALNRAPQKNTAVEEQELSNGCVRLIYPIEPHPRMLALITLMGRTPTLRERKLELDEMGTMVWKMIDGRTTVRDLIDAFAARYQTHPRETEVAMTSFIRSLGKKGLIGLK